MRYVLDLNRRAPRLKKGEPIMSDALDELNAVIAEQTTSLAAAQALLATVTAEGRDPTEAELEALDSGDGEGGQSQMPHGQGAGKPAKPAKPPKVKPAEADDDADPEA